jgi:ParB family chromosome partitioning protein
MKIPIEDIVIKERVRQDMGDLAPLMESMQKHGQLNSITITRDNELIAGHRRLLSAQELGWAYIDAMIVERDSEAEKLQLELEENVHRKDFSPEELLAGYRRLDKLLKPRLTRRLSNFLGGFFGKLFRRKKRIETPQPESLTATANSDVELKDKGTKCIPEQTEASPEVGQYGV